jgi:predicted secreted hydrolase
VVRRRDFLASPFALLAADRVPDYATVSPGHRLDFPRDFGSHPTFRNEWWYITAWVKGENGIELGVQVTFFRNRPRVAETNPSRFAPRQLLFAHAAIADARELRLRHDQRAARAGFGLAEAAENTTRVIIGDWLLVLIGGAYLARVAARDFGFELTFAPTQGMLLHGNAGFSRKGPTLRQASYYYSQPQLAVSGRVSLVGAETRVSGIAWLDHEWSSEMLAPDAIGWDWAGINLSDGSALMAFRMRDRSAGAFWAGGTRRTADGSLQNLESSEVRFTAQRYWRSPRTGFEYPVAMVLSAGTVEYVLEPLMEDQELDSRASTGTVYWEGAVRAMQAGREVGRGYLELTGYGQPLKL